MKCLSIWQPWAQLLASGVKRVETRSWMTAYSGPVAIHAASRMSDADMSLIESDEHFREAFRDYWDEWNKDAKIWGACDQDAGVSHPITKAHWSQAYGDLPFGAIIGIADLRICLGTDSVALHSTGLLTPAEYAFGDFRPGRYAWIFDNARLITPIPYCGRQKLFNVPDEFLRVTPCDSVVKK